MYNRIILMGRLTADPELKTTQSGIPMCRVSVAVDRGYAKQGEEKKTDFFDVTFWRQQAEFVSRYFSKGRAIHIEGRLQNDNYTDQNGQKHYRTSIVADNVCFCGDKGTQGAAGNAHSGSYNNPAQNSPSNPSAAYSARQTPQTASAPQLGTLDDFEEILSDGAVPF